MRAYGRRQNSIYMEFLQNLDNCILNPQNLDDLRRYDFEFHAWPVSFQMPLLPEYTSNINAW